MIGPDYDPKEDDGPLLALVHVLFAAFGVMIGLFVGYVWWG